MSGRSAHVRKKQGPKESGAGKRPIIVSSVYETSSALPSPPPSTRKVVTGSSARTQHAQQVHTVPVYSTSHGSSTSSAGSGAQHQHQSLHRTQQQQHQYVASAIEKSSIRAFMDSKSSKVRDKLSLRFGSSRAEDQVFRPESALAARIKTSLEMPTSNTATARARMVKSPDGLGMQYEPSTSSLNGRAARVRSVEESMPKRWLGSGRPPHPWNKMKRDPELWDPTGDTLVFFGHETQIASRPPASFRIRSQMLEETQSAFLITILREGYVYNSEFNMPPSPTSQYLPSHESSEEIQYASYPRRAKQNTQEPPAAYEVYFPAPLNLSPVDSLRHHMTTRNVFALLMHKSLVGFTFGQALMDLHERLEMYMPPDCDVAGMLCDYVLTKNLDDVRNDPSTAAGLLAWCESPMVRWQEGWIDGFVHCVGMHARVTVLPEWREISYISRQLIDRASLDLQVRVRDIEDRFATFNFSDMWPMTSAMQPAARSSFERCQKFMIKFYTDVFWSWPPPVKDGNEAWFTRDLAMRLQQDFGALYDYLVDRDVIWDESEERSTRKWKIVSRTLSSFRADTEDLPVTDIFVAFDNRHRFPHVPHPFPLLPVSQPVSTNINKGSSLFSRKQRPGDERALEQRAALAYSNATNINLLGSNFAPNEFVEAFAEFEKTDRPAETDPYDGRRGRWILIYGMLQILATASVDTPGVRWTDDVQYLINPRLRGVPPWQSPTDAPIEEASHQLSYCWTTVRGWNRSRSSSQGDLVRDSRTDLKFSPREDSFRPADGIVSPGESAIGKGSVISYRAEPLSRKVTSEQASVDQSVQDNGLLAGSESDELGVGRVISNAEFNIGGQRAKDWVNSGGGFKGSTVDTIAIRSQREKVRDWPIQTIRERREPAPGKGAHHYNHRPDW